MISVRRCWARRMAAAVFPTAVGPTIIITVGSCKALYYLVFRAAGLFGVLFLPFPVPGIGLFFSFQAKAFGAFGQIIFLLDFGELVTDHPLGAILGRRDPFGFDDGGIFQLAILFLRHIDQLHQEAPLLYEIVYIDELLVGITDLRPDGGSVHQ